MRFKWFNDKLSKPEVVGKHTNKELGDYGEKLAVKYLKKQGYKIIETNYKIKYGEIDIIARDKEFLVFIEVKYRSKTLYGLPSEAVEKRKQDKIKMVASQYMLSHYDENNLIRFDVVQIIGDKVELFRAAFN